MNDSLVQIEGGPGRRPRLPEWARKPRTHFSSLHALKGELRRLGLHTVCESARCPNIHECFHRRAATFMILGDRCTRACGFCSVPKGRPPLDPSEPANVARMAAALDLRYVVITSVNRDDLSDGGSRHFAETVRAVRRALPHARVEVPGLTSSITTSKPYPGFTAACALRRITNNRSGFSISRERIPAAR